MACERPPRSLRSRLPLTRGRLIYSPPREGESRRGRQGGAHTPITPIQSLQSNHSNPITPISTTPFNRCILPRNDRKERSFFPEVFMRAIQLNRQRLVFVIAFCFMSAGFVTEADG